ncbi:MAG: phosphoribosylglycinamide formyltransferase [Clostridiales bacterium]|nr:phosphoribosylglycinamide formyltransferase [Clostridiales bacterium]
MNDTTTPKRLAVLVSGGGTNMQAVMDGIAGGEVDGEIVAVISSNAKAYALERARANKIPAHVCALKDYPTGEERDDAILKILQAARAEYVLLAGYLGILTDSLLNAYENRVLNIHPSLLPSFGGRGCHGLKVHEAALRRGVKVTGATAHFVSREVDAGPIVLQKAVPVLDGDTPETLQKRVMEQAEYVVFPEAVKLLCAGRLEIKDGKVRER